MYNQKHTQDGSTGGESGSEENTRVSRRGFIKGAGVTATVAAGGSTSAAALPFTNESDVLSEYARLNTDWMGGLDYPTNEVFTLENTVWIVEYENDAYNAWIEDYVSSSEEREYVERQIHDSEAGTGRVKLALPKTDVVDPWAFGESDTIVEKSDVTNVAPVRYVPSPDFFRQGELSGSGSWASPGSWVEKTVFGGIPASGNRFDEVGPYDLADVRTAVNRDAVPYRGAGVTIGIVDSGLQYDSTLYGSRVVAGKNTQSGEEIDPSTDDYTAVEKGNEHGSWVTTAAAGNGRSATGEGIAPEADIVAVQALQGGEGKSDDIVRGIEECVENGCDLINLSLRSVIPAEPITRAVRRAVTDGGVSAVVAAAGNSRMTTHYMGSPASSINTIPIASIDAEPAEEALSAYYSSVAPHPGSEETMGVAAPGHRVNADVKGDGEIRDAVLSGTSMAAPIVSGVAALLIESDDSLRGSPTALRERLENTATPLPKAGVTEVGAGRVDVEAAVTNTEPGTTQTDIRGSDAKARDTYNKNVIGGFF